MCCTLGTTIHTGEEVSEEKGDMGGVEQVAQWDSPTIVHKMGVSGRHPKALRKRTGRTNPPKMLDGAWCHIAVADDGDLEGLKQV